MLTRGVSRAPLALRAPVDEHAGARTPDVHGAAARAPPCAQRSAAQRSAAQRSAGEPPPPRRPPRGEREHGLLFVAEAGRGGGARASLKKGPDGNCQF